MSENPSDRERQVAWRLTQLAILAFITIFVFSMTDDDSNKVSIQLPDSTLEENETKILIEIDLQLDEIIKKCEKYKIQTMFDEKKDFYDCFIEIHAGAGGTEAQDWACRPVS